MAVIHDLLEVTDISENTTYSTAAGNLLGVVDNVSSSDLNDGEFDKWDDIQIDGVTYNIDQIQEPSSAGSFTLGDGNSVGFYSSVLEGNLDVVFLTVSNGADVRHFIIPNDSYGNGNVQSIETGGIRNVGFNDAGVISTTNSNINIVCFVAGSMIKTPQGDAAVEEVQIGDLVLTHDNGPQQVRAILVRELDFTSAPERLKPVLFEKGSLGPNRPNSKLYVSPQHRMLVSDQSGTAVLVPAKALTSRQGVRVAQGKRQVTYIHLVFSKHEIIYANGTPTESFFPGRMALEAIPASCRSEVYDIFGDDVTNGTDDAKMFAAPILRVQEAQRQALSFT
ncbi:MAG: Hint domain-containing protein [Roseovarius sp.]|nr:Hint domain-containing protein [Roseovarius sp.]